MYMYLSFPKKKIVIPKVDSNEITCFLVEIKLNKKLLWPSTYLGVIYIYCINV